MESRENFSNRVYVLKVLLYDKKETKATMNEYNNILNLKVKNDTFFLVFT